MRQLKKWKKAGEETHHLLEQRMLDRKVGDETLGEILKRKGFKNADDMPGVNIDEAVHQKFTNAWRQRFPYKGEKNYTETIEIEDLLEAIKEVYANQPGWVKVLEEVLLPI